MAQNFTFANPTRVVFGPGAADSVGQEAARLGSRAFVVTGTTFARRSGLIDRLQASFQEAGVTVTVFDGIGPNPATSVLDEAGRLARQVDAELVVGLGGGSTMDAAKATALAACTDRPVWDFARHSRDTAPAEVEKVLPIVQVPIVASTGSETNDTAIVYQHECRLKAPISSSLLYARVAVVDPILTFTVPPQYTAVGGLNIVSQLLESYLTRDEFPVTDRITEGLMRVVMDSLPRAMRRGEDLDARTNLSWVAALASTVIVPGQGGNMPLRAMAHPLCAHYGIDHGSALAALWPSYMRYALANRFRLPQIGRFKRYALLGRQIFGVHETDDEVAAETTTYRFINWLKGLDVPTDLRSFSIDPDTFGQLADEAILISGSGQRLPGGLSARDVEHIYDGALRTG